MNASDDGPLCGGDHCKLVAECKRLEQIVLDQQARMARMEEHLDILSDRLHRHSLHD